MRPKARAASIGIALALGAACGSIDSPPPLPVPVNACAQSSCASYGDAKPSCIQGRCVSTSSLDYTLVVSLPESSFLDPAATIAIPQFPAFLENERVTDITCVPPGCAQIPRAATPQGALTVENVAETCAGRPTPTQGGAPSIPAQVRFHPQWPVGSTSVHVDASAVALPLLPTPARTFATTLAGTTSWQWIAVVGPGLYEEEIVPEDEAYPPVRIVAQAASLSGTTALSIDVDECKGSNPLNTTFTVTRGAGSLLGFRVYLRDSTTSRRISSVTTLPDARSAQVTLLTSGVLPLPAGEAPTFLLVVAPPQGAPIPTLADFVPPTGKLGAETFPTLPTVLKVSGTVVAGSGSDQKPIEADLIIDSTATTPGGIGGIATIPPNDPAQKFLHYSTTAHSAAADGSYSVDLPPGSYDVFIAPALGVAAGAASVPLLVRSAPQNQPPVAEGKTLVAASLATITGRATIADGRVFAGAEVEARAAASLAATLDQRRWPRTVSGLTDAAGKFTLSVDPGLYDIVVRPPDGTGFPWVTVPSQNVAAGQAFTLPSPVVVPAPIQIDLVLHDQADQGGNPIVGAIVRAYAPATLPPASGAPPPQVELGTWMTDTTGHFTMFVAPPQ